MSQLLGNNFNQAGYNYGIQPNAVPINQSSMNNPLSAEQREELKKASAREGFTLQVPSIDFTAACCTHKSNHEFDYHSNQDGSITCHICNRTFVPVEYETEEVAAIVQTLLNVLQSTKLYYVDIPDAVAKDYFQIIPLIEKLPQLYDIAKKNFYKYGTPSNTVQTQGINGFSAFNALMSGSFYGNPAAQGYNPAYGQPQQQQQQVNPFGGYNQQVPQGQPPMPNPATVNFNTQAPYSPLAPQSPTVPPTNQVVNTMNV